MRTSRSTARSARRSTAATSSVRSRSFSASRPRPTSWRSARSTASRCPGRPSRASSSHTRASCTGCSRPRHAACATRTAGGASVVVESATDDRPFPPGEYPLIVIGSGPGGLQLSYALGKHGVPHAVLSRDPAAGGMFRKWPFFQRLLSWTKPYAPEARTAREYQRYDWNSLIADEPELRSLQAEFMDGTSYFPSRPEMQANLEAFAERAGIAVRYGCRWQSTAKEDGDDGTTFVLQTNDGEYRAKLLVLAVGVADPWKPSPPGIELSRHYADTREASSYAGKRVFIIGKQNSGFELASGLAAWASSITV